MDTRRILSIERPAHWVLCDVPTKCRQLLLAADDPIVEPALPQRHPGSPACPRLEGTYDCRDWRGPVTEVIEDHDCMDVIRHDHPRIEVDTVVERAHSFEGVRHDAAHRPQAHCVVLDGTEEATASARARSNDVCAAGRVVEADKAKPLPMQCRHRHIAGAGICDGSANDLGRMRSGPYTDMCLVM
jgi:hypothetical protein